MNSSTAEGILMHGRRDSVEETTPMHMAQKARRWTRADLERLPDDGNRYEVVRGELFVTPVPRPAHDAIVDALAELLEPYVAGQSLGRVQHSRPAVIIDDSHVEPDIVVRPTIRPVPKKWEAMPSPILLVEVLSDSTQRRDRVAKRSLYLDSGLPEYWILDGERRTITVVRAGHADEVVNDRLRWHPAQATAPLEIDVEALFHDALD
jgi:Uma2 family endonuclease